MKDNNNDLALKAIVNKNVQNKIIISLKKQLQQQESIVNLLKKHLVLLENIQEISDQPQNTNLIIDVELELLRRQLDEM